MNWHRSALTALAATLGIVMPPARAEERPRRQAADSSTRIFEKQCPKGRAANEFPDWEHVRNNAVRAADKYATSRNPAAFFLRPDVSVVFQAAGADAGKYRVILIQKGSTGTSFAALRPNFDFCTDPARLDDNDANLFTVVLVKLDGKPL